jgi:hypothetical protein
MREAAILIILKFLYKEITNTSQNRVHFTEEKTREKNM